MRYNFGTLRLSQHRWIGAAPGYNEAFNAFVKTIPVRCWDPNSKTWWMPEQFEHLVREKLVELGLLTREAESAWVRQLLLGADTKGVQDADLAKRDRANAFRALRVDVSQGEPPREFVRQAYWYWKTQWSKEHVYSRVAEVEEAWRTIFAEDPP